MQECQDRFQKDLARGNFLLVVEILEEAELNANLFDFLAAFFQRSSDALVGFTNIEQHWAVYILGTSNGPVDERAPAGNLCWQVHLTQIGIFLSINAQLC